MDFEKGKPYSIVLNAVDDECLEYKVECFDRDADEFGELDAFHDLTVGTYEACCAFLKNLLIQLRTAGHDVVKVKPFTPLSLYRFVVNYSEADMEYLQSEEYDVLRGIYSQLPRT